MNQPDEEMEEFDATQARLAFKEKQRLALERMQREVEAYEQNYGADGVPREAEEEMVIAGVRIPATTPQEPESLVRRVETDRFTEPDTMLTNLPQGSGKHFKTEKIKNPNYVSPEDRAAALVRAERALRQEQEQWAREQRQSPGQMKWENEYSIQRQQSSQQPLRNNGQEAVSWPRPAPRQREPLMPAPIDIFDHGRIIQQILRDRYTVVGCQVVNNQIVITLE